MEGIIGKESESILRFFILLENIQVKMDQLMEGNRPPFNGERFLTDRELSGLLKISRRCLQDYTCVLLMFVCPIILAMLSIGIPEVIIRVPNECLAI